MSPFANRRLRPLSIVPVLLACGAAALLLFVGNAGAQSKRVVDEAENAALGRTVLTNLQGRTLYSLSSEVRGHFDCTGACLSTWRPLTVAKGVKPTGPVKLGTVKRPDGHTQVTFKGRPLYRFSGDTKKGDAGGEGFKDVGTWHAATVSKVSSPPPAPQPETPPYPY